MNDGLDRWKKALEGRHKLISAALGMADQQIAAMEEMSTLRVDLLVADARVEEAGAECDRLRRLLRLSRAPRRQGRRGPKG